jgi:hypothetical protein
LISQLHVAFVAMALATVAEAGQAQLATVGIGALLSNRPTEPVFELHVASPPFYRTRAYTTFSWTDDSSKPTLITAAERSLVTGRANIGLGAGLLWLEGNDYDPYPIIVSSAVVPLPIPRTSIVAIGSTQPFQDWDWSLVLKVGVLAWFRK